MIRIPIVFPRWANGHFSHFAHFICDFTLPFYSFLKKQQLLSTLKDTGITLEIRDRPLRHFGPLFPLLEQIFPNLEVEYTKEFSQPPLYCGGPSKWDNLPEDVNEFVIYLKETLRVKSSDYGVVVVQRGYDHNKYPGGGLMRRSGADRRTIGSGFSELVERVKQIRRDSLSVTLEDLSLSEQVALFLNADTLIAQHGAAFVHAHWMPHNSNLIELQCCGYNQCPMFVPTIAGIKQHKLFVVEYPCDTMGVRSVMRIDDNDKITQLIKIKPHII